MTILICVVAFIGLVVNFFWSVLLITMRKYILKFSHPVLYSHFLFLGITDTLWSLSSVMHTVRILPHLCDVSYFIIFDQGENSSLMAPTIPLGQDFCRQNDVAYFMFFSAASLHSSILASMAIVRYLLTTWDCDVKMIWSFLGILIF